MAETIGTAYIQIEPSFSGVTPKIEQHFGGEGEKSGGSFVKGFASVVGTVGQVAGAAAAAGAGAVASIVKSSVSNFGEFQQLAGGVETLFGSSYATVEEYAAGVGMSLDDAAATFEQYQQRQQTVMDNANNAYMTAGMSANEYMETVTSFAASLNSSLGEYAWQSANYADIAVRDMSDNANKMGTSMESIQNAYQGFAKQNYTMLDNLKLGYGGTKKEMERLIRDAEELEGYEMGSLNVENFGDIIEAIHIVQENLGITGTTAEEADKTITGSLASIQAAWQNVLTGMGTEGADMSGLIDNLVKTTETFLSNMMPTILTSLSGVADLISQLAPLIAQMIPELLSQVAPGLLTAGVQVVQALGQGLLSAIPVMMPTITELVIQLTQMIISMLPQLIEVGAQVLLSLATGIAEALPTLIPTIVEVILTIVSYLVENVDLLIDAAIALILGLAEGLINALPLLIEKAPEIILKLCDAFINNAPKLIIAAAKLIGSLIVGLVENTPKLIAQGILMMFDFLKMFDKFGAKMVEVGKQLIAGIKKGISDAWDSLVKWFNEKLGGLVDGIKKFFEIGSPSKLMAKEVGVWIPAGIAEGIDEGMGALNKSVDEMTADLMGQSMNANVSGSVDYSVEQHDNSLYNLLAQYLPQIAKGEKVQISLDGDAGRLFRLMQIEAMKNTQLVGTGVTLATI